MSMFATATRVANLAYDFDSRDLCESRMTVSHRDRFWISGAESTSTFTCAPYLKPISGSWPEKEPIHRDT